MGISSLQYEWLRDIGPRVTNAVHNGKEYASIIGERLMTEVHAAMGRVLIDPSRARRPLPPSDPRAWRTFYEQLTQDQDLIWPGNTSYDGKRAQEISEGGSDTTGGLIAFASFADIYRNYSDTPAQSVSPKIITDANRRRTLSHLTYKEGRELGRNGTGLLHPAAIVPLMGTGIPTEVRNTFDPNGPYTLYTDEVDNPNRAGQVMAVSVIENVTVISVEEPGMSDKVGRVAALASGIAEKVGVPAIDIVGHGSDAERFIVDGKNKTAAQRALQELVNGGGTVTAEDWALITLVGYELGKRSDIRPTLDLPEGHHWLDGKHSLRFTVKSGQVLRVVDDAHYNLIEKTQSKN